MQAKTFTEVHGKSYPGLFVLEKRLHTTAGYGYYGYLSAEIAPNRFISVEKWIFDGPPPLEADLRARLVRAISRARKH